MSAIKEFKTSPEDFALACVFADDGKVQRAIERSREYFGDDRQAVENYFINSFTRKNEIELAAPSTATMTRH
jgi:hypothetical protein